MAQTGRSGARGGGRKSAGAYGADLRSAEQAWLSRRLHDDIGPSLCAAGLQLSLLRTELGELPAASADALDNVQTILEYAVDSVRLLSYALCPAHAAKCSLRDIVRMSAKAFNAEIPESDRVPTASPAAAAELAAQLLDCLLLSSLDDRGPARVLFSARAVSVEAPASLGDAFGPIAQRRLRHWSCSLRTQTRRKRTTISWDLDS